MTSSIPGGVTILIPCLNERKTIRKATVNALRAGKRYFLENFEVIVVDNGSTDGSLQILRKFNNIKILPVGTKGYGAALHSGIQKSNKKFVIYADADLSYNFNEVGKFKKYMTGNFDLILGSRLTGKISKNAMPLLNRYLGTPVLSLLIRLLYGINVSDCNSGMRAVKVDFYKKLKMRNSGMEWASEILIKTALKGGKYVELPINYTNDMRMGNKPHLIPWSDGWRHLKAILLLKPESLVLPAVVFFLIALLLVKINQTAALLALLASISLILSTLAAWLINSTFKSIENNVLLDFFLKLPLVRLTGLFSAVALLVAFIPVLSPNYSVLVISIIAIFNMWVFLIETIKTHLVNPLQ